MLELQWLTPQELADNPINWRTHPTKQLKPLAAVIREVGWAGALLYNKTTSRLIDGHARKKLDKSCLVQGRVPVLVGEWSEEQERIILTTLDPIAALAETDRKQLRALLDIVETDDKDIQKLLALQELKAPNMEETCRSLADDFIVPPFSVLNAQKDWWQKRKQQWFLLNLKSSDGRADGLALPAVDTATAFSTRFIASKGTTDSGTSIFDPVLCELLIRWFSPPVGVILDPFAGGPCRGIVSNVLGRRYTGYDISQTQIDANNEAAAFLTEKPTWVCGDSQQLLETAPACDFILSCPPYGDMEHYSDDPQDLSNMSASEFLIAYRDIIAKSCERLKDNRFAAFVVAEYRDKNGNYTNFVGETVEAFRSAGLHFYNELILITMLGSVPLRCAKGFETSRKIGKTHQNVLVFLKGEAKLAHQNILVFTKGDPRIATQDCGPTACDIDPLIDSV